MIRRIASAIAVSVGLVLVTGLWMPARAALTEFGFDSPGDGEVTSTRIVPVQMHATSDAPKGLQYLQLRIAGTGFPERVVWCVPGTAPNSCSSWGDGTSTYRGTFNWDTRNLTQYNGDFMLKLIVRENGAGPAERSIGVRVNTPPATPAWENVQATTSSGRPAVLLRWRANSEPDIISYQIRRSSSTGGASLQYDVNAANPGASGCSLSAGSYSCTDTQFPQSGYGGQYTYYVSANRSSPVSPSGVRSGQAARSTSVNEPRPASNSGPRPGPGTQPGPGGNAPAPGSTPAPAFTPTPDPFAPRASDFYGGTYKPTLPYRDPNKLQVLQNREVRAAGFTEEVEVPLDVRRTLLPVAGGLFTVTAALHFRRVLRDSH